VEKDKTKFERYARTLIDFILDGEGNELVFNELASREASLKEKGRVNFLGEYIPAKLALACGFWDQCCEVHGIRDKGIRKIYFLEVMKRFETPDSLPVATRFSENLYAVNSNPEDAPLISVMTRFFETMGLKRFSGESAQGSISDSFVFMMEVGDALKNAFENEFEDLVCADEMIPGEDGERRE